MDSHEINECLECGELWSGENDSCPSCGVVLEDAQDCPRCANDDLYDPVVGFCHACGYTGSESVYDPITVYNGPPRCIYCGEREEPYHFCGPVPTSDGEEYLPAVDAAESFDFVKRMGNVVSVTYKPEPYQPFFDLIEDLKKWHIKVEPTTKTGLNGWLSRQTSKVVGVDVTHMAKAFGPRVFIPDHQWGTKSGYLSLVHEATHAKDFWKFGVIPFFLMQYILPFGPSFTALFEYRAYVAQYRAEKKVYGSLVKGTTERVAKALASRGYKYCFPWPKLMQRLLDRAIGD